MKITLSGNELVLEPRRPEELKLVRSLPVRKFDGQTETWRARYVRENWEILFQAGYVSEADFPFPMASAFHIDVIQKKLAVRVPPTTENIFLCKKIPDNKMWAPKHEAWLCKPTASNVAFIEQTWPQASWSDEAKTVRQSVQEAVLEAAAMRDHKEEVLQTEVEVNDYKFGTEPFQHQLKGFVLARGKPAYAFFMEQGTGKSKLLIDEVCDLYLKGEINGVILICPNSVKTNWPDEINIHSPKHVYHEPIVWDAGLSKRDEANLWKAKHDGLLPWLIMNVDAFSSQKGLDYAIRFASKHDVLTAVDESTKIKTPGAKRTKNILKLRPVSRFRRIMSGTPVTQGPLDVYAPCMFLDPNILGFSSFFSFKHHFAVMGGYAGKQVIGYSNLEELQNRLDPYSYRVLKADCLDLPEKIFQRLTVEMTPEQKRLYKAMKDEMLAEFSDKKVEVTMVLTQMLRLAQITGGFLPDPDNPGEVLPIPGTNAKMEAVLETLENIQGKAILWSRFRPEIALISQRLRQEYGHDSVVEFHGGIDTEGRKFARHSFQDPDCPVRFFVGQIQTGGIGLTLTQARTVFYFSNSFSLEDRLQSEDRAHRIGQKNNVTYIDVVAKGTLDVRVLSALRQKKNVANLVTGDNWQAWI